MANPRVLDKRRKSIRNIKKITRTMELIATARFKKAMDRALAATAYTQRIVRVVSDLASAGLEVSHPLLDGHAEQKAGTLLVLTANRGLCGGYNGNVLRQAMGRRSEFEKELETHRLEVSGKRGVNGFKFRGIDVDESFLNFNDQPAYSEVDVIASRYIEEFTTGKLDRLDVAYTRFDSVARQEAVVETLLPLGSLGGSDVGQQKGSEGSQGVYDFLPSAESILEEVVPMSFKVKLYKCFLDAAVSEQVARMVAMKSATENANDMIKNLSRTYNRARQGRITSEIMDVIGGVEALEG